MENSEQYTVDHFIAKFSAIPEDKWCRLFYENDENQKCALGHCGVRNDDEFTKEAYALIKLLGRVTSINDNKFNGTPKHNILLALEAAKKNQKNGTKNL